MSNCPQCGASRAPQDGRCPECGAPASPPASDDATIVQASVESPAPASASPASSRPSHERFAPGTVLAERYRILGKVGAGGMGEVYRAEDATLDQIVALKFLPPEFSRREDWRQRFLQEVRLARQVSHPNVCRVYDVGDVQGELFLSMEFVEGRDLGSVLRSIGRLPEEKALDIARQLCAGISALHDRGVLHRDLKPANVMLDEDGRVRITDFGLAGVADHVKGAEIRSGTPQYMAPEQLDGREVTVRSDIYALGLVLYEIFTGKAAFQGSTVKELTELHRSAAPSRISSHVSEIDPAVERIVNRCLEKDPLRRPPSALVVSTALPGGDPLAAALAMGETPSPELVAASGGTGGIHPLLGVGLILLTLLGVALHAGLTGRDKLVHYVDMERSAGALEERARQLVIEMGYPERPVDRYASFARSGDMLEWFAKQDSSAGRWAKLTDASPLPVLFWYRQSPRYLVSDSAFDNVTYADPAPVITDMVSVTLDAAGQLLYFAAVPPEEVPAMADSAAATERLEERWDALFEAAGLDRDDFVEVEPSWIPDEFAMPRRAWRGASETAGYPIEVTIEAGSLGDRPVYFRYHGPWTEGRRTVPGRPSVDGLQFLMVFLVIGVLAAGCSLAWRNHRRRRTDLAGAGRVAMFLLLMPILRWVFLDHHAPLPQTLLNRFFEALSIGALYAMMCVALYLALEPIVRRVWPQVMIGWTRLIVGGWRDPMVGRSVLVGGGMFGATVALFEIGGQVARQLMDVPPRMPGSTSFVALAEPRALFGMAAMSIPNSLFNALFFLMVLVLGRLLLRRAWAAYLLLTALTSLILAAGSDPPVVGWIVGPLVGLLWTTVLVRSGMLTFFTGFLLVQFFGQVPLTLRFGQIYAGSSITVLILLFGVLALALVSALGGRSFLSDVDR